ncbi:MAG: copper amine oxidase N-terminal domain-containing protein [Syntrophomonas sp.]
MMKKGFLFALLTLAMFIVPLPARADDTPRVILDGQEISFDVPPVVVDGRVLVPFSKIFQSFGRESYWDSSRNAVVGGGFWMGIGENVAYIGDRTISLDVPAQTVNGRVMVPLKLIAEVCYCQISYDGSTNTVNLTSGQGRLNALDVCPEFNPYSRSAMGCVIDIDRQYNALSPQIYGVADFSGTINRPVIFSWYFESGNNRELVLEESKDVINNQAVSILPHNNYKAGKWALELKMNDQVIQPRYFTIVDNPSGWGEVKITGGQYRGYLNQIKDPWGVGKLKMDNGIIVTGEIDLYREQKCDILPYESNISTLVVLKECDYSKNYSFNGYWTYPDNSVFSGHLYSELVAKSKADAQANKYDLYYNVYGEYKAENGEVKKIDGYYKGYDPSYRFDRATIYSSLDDAIKSSN